MPSFLHMFTDRGFAQKVGLKGALFCAALSEDVGRWT